jgi:ubiquinone/menaquinone biosynthesis C-methylase UbiE
LSVVLGEVGVPNNMSRRLQFQRNFSIPPILNIGSGEDPARFGEQAVHLDLDKWKHTFSVQADAHHLPFKDDSFRTAVLGDVLEHVVDPLKVLMEAKRVAQRIVLTVFEEWRLGSPGLHLEAAHRKMDEIRKLGFCRYEDYFNSINRLIKGKGKLVAHIPDEEFPHTAHIWQFTDEHIRSLVEALDMKIIYFEKAHESYDDEGHPWLNWLICLERE